MVHARAGAVLVLPLLLLGAACASTGQPPLQSRRDGPAGAQKPAVARADGEEDAAPLVLAAPVVVQDDALGLKYELPQLAEGWQVPREGRGARRGQGVQVEVGSFPMSRPATPSDCREAARKRLGLQADKPGRDGKDAQAGKAPQGKDAPPAKDAAPGKDAQAKESKDSVREQAIGDWPTATWSFTRGPEEAPVRSRWAFYPRGADCLLLEVSGPRDARFPDVVFQTASRTLKILPVPRERQRDVDLLAGMGFLERRDAPAALERFESLAQREPDFAKAHFGALMAGFEIGPQAYPRALPHGLLALRADRDLSPEQRQLALRAVGVMQLAEDQLKPAAQTLAELVVRAPDLAEGQYNYACALARLGDKPAALQHLAQAIRLDTDLVKHAKDDPDLKTLKGDEAFEKLLRNPPPPIDASRRSPRIEVTPEGSGGDED